jgi:hypothetical protein
MHVVPWQVSFTVHPSLSSQELPVAALWLHWPSEHVSVVH